MKCTSSWKSKAAPQHVSQPKIQFETREKWEFTWITKWMNQLPRHTLTLTDIVPVLGKSHPGVSSHSPRATKARGSLYQFNIPECQHNGQVCSWVKPMPCVNHDWSFSFKVSPLKTYAKNWAANQTQHCRHNTQTKQKVSVLERWYKLRPPLNLVTVKVSSNTKFASFNTISILASEA